MNQDYLRLVSEDDGYYIIGMINGEKIVEHVGDNLSKKDLKKIKKEYRKRFSIENIEEVH